MTFDSVLDLLESRRVRIGAVVLLAILAFFFARSRQSLEPRVSRVCGSLYRLARTAVDTAEIDTSRTALRDWHDQVVIPAETCGDLRRAGRIK